MGYAIKMFLVAEVSCAFHDSFTVSRFLANREGNSEQGFSFLGKLDRLEWEQGHQFK